ncbi:BTB/POZ domain-containing protein 6-like [Mya arenaria]|uniref:BTB/POZ domain-containing protein 6-like n=1 Tax=Mya arenaria TaxID=6604 RepID=UPI0022E690F9|nr:BTB/POZ domain-containing protein 6-like [Mya arenaria]
MAAIKTMLNEDWQSPLAVGEGLWHLFVNQVACDMFFELGLDLERMGAHSVVLMARSVVWFRELADGLPQKDISLPEIAPEEFTCFLRYLYTGELKIEGISVDKVLSLAERYGARELIKQLVAIQLETMDAEMFCPFVRKNENHMTELIKHKCLEYVFNQPFKVFQSGTFSILPRSFLKEILEHEMLVIDEEVLCTAVLLWVSKECETAHMEVNGKNQRKVLGDMIYLIRFPLLSQDYFTENISEKGLLTEHEEVQLLKYFLKAKNAIQSLKFETKKRTAPKVPFKFSPHLENGPTVGGLHTTGSRPILATSETEKQGYVSRFTERGIGWGYRSNRKDAIAFTVSGDIILKYIDIYGTCKDNGTLDVTVALMDTKKQVSETDMKVPCQLTNASGLYEVGIENDTGSYGVHLKAGTEYHLILTINGGNTFYGKNGKAKVFADGIEFNFMTSQYSTNNTNTNIGQIAALKFTIV